MDRKTELHVRHGTPEDTEAILRLVASSLGEGSIPRERPFWRWKHHENPFGPSPVLLAEADGRLVGLRVFMRWEWRSGNKPFRAVRAVDTATHPDWRGRGIFSRLTLALVDELRADGVHFVFNTPNEQSRPGYLKMGWQAVGRTSPWIRPLRPLRLVRLIAGRAPHPAAIEDETSPGEEFPSAADLCDRPELASLIEEACSSREADSRLATPLSLEYLRWRYASIPNFQYHALLEVDGPAAAAVIFRHKKQGALSELRICDLLVAGRRGGRIARALLARLRRASGADYLTAMAAGRTPEQRALIRSGFLPAIRRGPVLTVRPLNALGGVDPRKLGHWRFSAGDLELF